VCRAEAPGVEQFARQHADQLHVIGLGTQDDLEMANEFVDEFGITHTLLWDESFQSWAELGVSLQPSAQLYDADGALLAEWLGPFDESEVLDLVAGRRIDATAGQQVTIDRFCRYVDRFARAQRDAAGYPTASNDQRQRILDDLRYAANASAQTAPPELAAQSELIAAAVREHSRVILDADLPADPTTSPGYGVSAAALELALAEGAEPAAGLCDVTLDSVATP
jgi:hypothetical protein